MGLDSYDRLFPSQDTMPKGGFGNLIALPLQHGPREDGNSVFVDDLLRPDNTSASGHTSCRVRGHGAPIMGDNDALLLRRPSE